MASHLTVSLLPSSTIIGFFIRFNFGAAAKKGEKEQVRLPNTTHTRMITVRFAHFCTIGDSGETRRQERAEKE